MLSNEIYRVPTVQGIGVPINYTNAREFFEKAIEKVSIVKSGCFFSSFETSTSASPATSHNTVRTALIVYYSVARLRNVVFKHAPTPQAAFRILHSIRYCYLWLHDLSWSQHYYNVDSTTGHCCICFALGSYWLLSTLALFFHLNPCSYLVPGFHLAILQASSLNIHLIVWSLGL